MNTAPAAAKTVAELVASYNAQVALNPECHGTEDVVAWLVTDTPHRSWTPSEIGKAVGISTHEAREYLRGLWLDGFIGGEERGAWTRYTAKA